MRRAKGEMSTDTLTHTHTIKLPRAGVQLVVHTSIILTVFIYRPETLYIT